MRVTRKGRFIKPKPIVKDAGFSQKVTTGAGGSVVDNAHAASERNAEPEDDRL